MAPPSLGYQRRVLLSAWGQSRGVIVERKPALPTARRFKSVTNADCQCAPKSGTLINSSEPCLARRY
jgi:hypothetical protein